MRYSIEEYDDEGFLKAPKWLVLGWLFLAKAWIIFIVAGVSREAGSELLAMIYPVHATLYIGLIAGLPVLILSWSISLRKPQRKWLCKLLNYGKGITQVAIWAQLVVVIYQIYLESARFSWANGITLLGLFWLLLYVSRSRRVKDCFCSPLMT